MKKDAQVRRRRAPDEGRGAQRRTRKRKKEDDTRRMKTSKEEGRGTSKKEEGQRRRMRKPKKREIKRTRLALGPEPACSTAPPALSELRAATQVGAAPATVRSRAQGTERVGRPTAAVLERGRPSQLLRDRRAKQAAAQPTGAQGMPRHMPMHA